MNALLSVPLKSVLRFIGAFGDFIYPPYCLTCEAQLERRNELLCKHCFDELPRIPENYNIRAELEQKLQQELHVSRILSLWEFRDDVQLLIHYFKYNHHRIIGNVLAQNLVKQFGKLEIMKRAEIIVPVPLHKRRLHKRGYNQSELISEGISQLINKPVVKGALRRIINTKSQTRLNAIERKKNVEKAFTILKQDSIIGRTVLLVDDVITTGSTMNACAEQLRSAGVKEVFALSAAKA
ncbi:hypothetical protein GF337_07310 [candidate division KSB1 bacterium]|nr:hypothetical protein [candidate division KSB1 bacterium]